MTHDSTAPTYPRRGLLRGGLGASLAIVGVGVGAGAVSAQQPDFSARIYGDGEIWGTKVTGRIENPNEHSLDRFFVVTNSNNSGTQLPVAESAPGNPDYNGGRWWTHTVMWTREGFDAHGTVPILTRYGPADDPASIQFHLDLGHLKIVEGPPDGGPPAYFRCPMLPAKDA